MSRIVFLTSLPVALLTTAVLAVPVPAFNGTWSGGYDTALTGVIGWAFEPRSDMWVTHLGTCDYFGNGLPSPVNVAIWDDASRQMLASRTITRPLGSYSDWFAFQATESAAPLSTGRRYVIGQLASVGNPNTFAGTFSNSSWHEDVKLIESRAITTATPFLAYPQGTHPSQTLYEGFYGLPGGMPIGPVFKFESGPPRPYAAWTDADYAIFVSVDDAVTIGEGVVQTDLGAQHRLSAQALSEVLTDGPKTSQCRRKFVLQRGDMGSEPTEVYLIGLLDGFLHATDGGYAKVAVDLSLLDADGQVLDSTSRLFDVSAPYGINNFDEEYFSLRPFWVNATIQPGAEYEFVSRLTVAARKGGNASTARAIFDNTFDVSISGVVPEPTTIALMLLGQLAMLGRGRARGG